MELPSHCSKKFVITGHFQEKPQTSVVPIIVFEHIFVVFMMLSPDFFLCVSTALRS